jgi:mannose/fructose/N-acetylgalactosamine-specific phosphotransferase system component IID
MKKKPRPVAKKEGNDTAGLLSLIATILLPLLMIFVFVRLLISRGAPVWYLILHGIVTVGMVVQVIQFIRMGLIGALRNRRADRRREGDRE